MTDEEFLLFLQLQKHEQQGIDFPDMTIISVKMGIPIEHLYSIIQSLIDKKIMTIVTIRNEQGKTEDKYDLTLIYTKIGLCMEQEQQKMEVKSEENKTSQLFQTFEQEFGRPLSPIELETIQLWLDEDNYAVELIELALREAVLNQAYSLKYIDRILLAWERKNLTSKSQIQDEQKKRLKQIEASQPVEEEQLPHIPMYNWLNPTNK